MNEKDIKDLYFCGDTHGKWKELVWEALNRFKIENARICVLGDFGVGFDNSLDSFYQWAERRLEKSNVILYALRGNHDDPEYFQSESKYSYPRLKFLEDHKVYNLSGREVYVIGGANSTDITWRLEENRNRGDKKNKVWWEGEDIVKKYNDLPGKVDIIATHSAPLSFDPIVKRFPETPEDQYEKILAERKYLDYVLKEITADYWFYGHFHSHYSGSFGNLLYKGLEELEIYEAPDPINRNPQGEDDNEQS